MLHGFVILAAFFTWLVTENPIYTIVVLVVGWIGASLLGKVMTWIFYALIAAVILTYAYAQITDQSFMKVLWQITF